MDIDPDEIELNQEHKLRIAKLARDSGLSWQTLIVHFLDNEEQRQEVAMKLRAGAEQAEQGNLIPGEEVFARLLEKAKNTEAQ